MGDFLSVLHVSFERGSQSLKATPQPTTLPSVLTIRHNPSVINGPELWYHIPHWLDSEPILGRNDISDKRTGTMVSHTTLARHRTDSGQKWYFWGLDIEIKSLKNTKHSISYTYGILIPTIYFL